MKRLSLVVGDKPRVRYQLQQDGSNVNITGYSFTFGAKVSEASTSYTINPVAGVIDDATAGQFSFTLKTTANVSVLASTFVGVFEIGMTNSSSERTTLTPAGGVAIEVKPQISS